MIVGILMIAFPIIILSINFGNVYNNYRVRKAASIVRKIKKSDRPKSIAPSIKLSKDFDALIAIISQELLMSSNKLDDISSKMGSFIEINSDLEHRLLALQGKSAHNITATVLDFN
eukprot:NODE_270_length_12222_cov_0.321868.p5 type:complete len:116 gc:universal NODE_270_length_12222_cov_0.321868:8464-8811(+)